MSAQPQTVTTPPAQAATALAKLSMEPLKPLLNNDGEMDLNAVNITERILMFQEFQQQVNANLPLWETSLLCQCSPGTTMIPIPVLPQDLDAWQGDDARKMKLKEGHVEPSADFTLRIASHLNVELVKVFEGVTTDSGSPMYEVQYDAWMMLPNGAIRSVKGEGKAQELYNTVERGGHMVQQKQAHIQESTRKKAKRNAIKALLGIPTSMPKEQFFRPWILLRPLFKPGVSPGTDRILAEIEAHTQMSKDMLYPKRLAEISSVDNGLTMEELAAGLKAAKTIDELEAARKVVGNARLTGDERKQLGEIYKAQKDSLSPNGASNSAPTSTPAQGGGGSQTAQEAGY